MLFKIGGLRQTFGARPETFLLFSSGLFTSVCFHTDPIVHFPRCFKSSADSREYEACNTNGREQWPHPSLGPPGNVAYQQ
jgi:hypothetical protein